MAGPIKTALSVVGWLVVAAIVFAILTLWNWDPIAFVSHVLNWISDQFLSWQWFRNLVGKG